MQFVFIYYYVLSLVSFLSTAMTLMLCIKCRKKKFSSNSDSDNGEDTQTNNNINVNNEPNIDTVDFVSPSLAKVYYQNEDTIYIPNSQQTPIHIINSDGSTRIKSNAINRALPDIPTNLNTLVINNEFCSDSQNSNENSLVIPLSPAITTHQNVTNLSINSDEYSPPTNYNLIQSKSTFNITATSKKENTTNKVDTQDFPSDHLHHSYARIKDSIIVDSSTENDTDDYYDSGIISKNVFDTQKTTINILPSSNQTVHNISNVENSSSLYAVSRINDLELPYHVSNLTHRNLSLNQTSVQSFESEIDDKPIKEVSYNKISVREPLSKVLAERAMLEHHYTEVYEQNNSFYEEISGSTNSSVTYTKIGELASNNQEKVSSIDQNVPKKFSNMSENLVFNQIPPPKTPPPPPPVENLLNVKNSSRSTSPVQCSSNTKTFNFDALYTQVNKLAKQNKRNVAQLNINDLYAKVQKNTKIKVPELAFSSALNKNFVYDLNDSLKLNSNFISKKIHSSTPEIYDKDFINTKQQTFPPPLPPLDNIPKSSKLASIYTNHKNKNSFESNLIDNNRFLFINSNNLNHKRSLSTGNSNKILDVDNENIQEDPNYEVCDNKLEDHSYEILKKKDNDKNVKSHLINYNVKKQLTESGYEMIKYSDVNTQSKDSDSDSPCYETISKQNDENEYISDPDYEVIKSNNLKSTKNSFVRKESDVSTEPGYERIRYISKKKF